MVNLKSIGLSKIKVSYTISNYEKLSNCVGRDIYFIIEKSPYENLRRAIRVSSLLLAHVRSETERGYRL